MYLELKKSECYLAPELLGLLGSESMRYVQSTGNDVFTLGLVALEMGTLSRVQACYDFERGGLSAERVEAVVGCFERRHGAFLGALVRSMVGSSRPSLAKVYESLMFNQLNLGEQLESSRRTSPYNYSSRKKNTSAKRQQQSNLSNQLQPLINSKAEVGAEA